MRICASSSTIRLSTTIDLGVDNWKFEVSIMKELAVLPQSSEEIKDSCKGRKDVMMNRGVENSSGLGVQGKVKSTHVGGQPEYDYFISNLVGPKVSQTLTN